MWPQTNNVNYQDNKNYFKLCVAWAVTAGEVCVCVLFNVGELIEPMCSLLSHGTYTKINKHLTY